MEDKLVLKWILDYMPRQLYDNFLKAFKNITPPHNHNRNMILIVNKQLVLPSERKKVNFLLSKMVDDISKKNKGDVKDIWFQVVSLYVHNEVSSAEELILKIQKQQENKIEKKSNSSISRELPKAQIVTKDVKDAKVDNLEKKIKTLEETNSKQNDKYKVKVLELTKKLKEQSEEYKELNKKLNNGEKNNIELSENIDILNKKLSNEQMYSKKKAEFALSAKNKIEELKEQVGQLIKENKNWENINENNLETIQEYKLKVSDLEKQIQVRSGDKEKVEKLDQEVELLHQKIESESVHVLQIELPNKISNNVNLSKLNQAEIIVQNKKPKADSKIKMLEVNELLDFEKYIDYSLENYEMVYIYRPELPQYLWYELMTLLDKENIKYFEQNTLKEFEQKWM